MPGAGDPAGGGYYILWLVVLPHHGRAKLIRDNVLQQPVDGLENRRQVVIARQPGRLPVAFGGIFNIHGDIVDQPLFHEAAQTSGEAAVCIKLDRKAQPADVAKQIQKLWLQERLAAGEADAV